MEKITIPGGVEVYYRVAGNGPPLLLLHGWGGSSRYWQGTLDHLGDIRTLYAPDLPGYGETPPYEDMATPEQVTSLIIAFANALKLDMFDINGHSFSAGVAARIAALMPQRVKRLIMTCPSTYRNEFERRMVGVIHHMTAVWMAMRRPWMANMRRIYLAAARPFFYRIPQDDTLLRESFGDFLRMHQPTALESAIHAVSPGYNEILQQVAVPTLVVGGRQDQLMPGYGPPLVAQLVQDGCMKWVERCGHLPMVERPNIYHKLIREFLTNDR